MDSKALKQVFIMVTDPILEGIYRNRLSSSSFCAVWYEKGEDWRQTLKGFTYDIIVIDLSTFSENPVENLMELQNISPDSEIIALSEQEDVQTVIGAFKAGISDLYLKPTDPETLSWAIEKIFRRKELKTMDAGLNADLAVFGVAHHISVAESDIKMRELAMRHIVNISNAIGGIWVWPEADKPKNSPQTRKNPYRLDTFFTSREHAVQQFDLFTQHFPGFIEESFETQLTTKPELWFRGKFAWIPLQHGTLGGILLFGMDSEVTKGMQARVEFLIRNLEVSLENHRRYIEAKHLTYIDDLTGLYNSRYLDITLNAAIQKNRSESSGFCILFMDLDHFKKVNDQHGHIVGSQTLVQVGKALKNVLRKIDHIFRYGGDEFIAILYEVSVQDATVIAERLRKNIENRVFHHQDIEVKVTVSIGISRFPEQAKDKKTILQMADKAMYEGKKAGRNKVFIAQNDTAPLKKSA